MPSSHIRILTLRARKLLKRLASQRWLRRITLGFLVVAIVTSIGFFNDIVGLVDRFFPSLSARSIPAFTTSATVADFFPFQIGSSWTYNYTKQAETGSPGTPSLSTGAGVFTETVVMSASGLSDKARIVGVDVQPFPLLPRCPQSTPIEGDADFWYIADKTRVFVACSREEANEIATNIVHSLEIETSMPNLPTYLLPFRVGDVWPAFLDLPISKEDPSYQWHVEAELDVVVPAGTFTNCFRILLYTNPDETIRWVCPFVGLVAEEYHHHGAISDYRAELASYRVGPIPQPVSRILFQRLRGRPTSMKALRLSSPDLVK